MIEYRVLGPLEVVRNGTVVSLSRPRVRALLALMLLRANEVVPADTLVDALWGDQLPHNAGNALQATVSRLRRDLEDASTGGSPIGTRPPGYVLEIEPDALDLWRFERLVSGGRARLAAGDPGGARTLLSEAFGLWRGAALADVTGVDALDRERSRLEEARLAALELRVEAELLDGRHAELVGELEALVAEHPYREELRAQLMLALYRAGRQAEALATYQEGRTLLVDELGIEPSRALQQLERAILLQDPTLELPESPREPARAGRSSFPAALDTGASLLVGRESDLDWLRSAWRDARSGAGSVLLLTGPSGIGKTRLCAALARIAHEDGAEVVYQSLGRSEGAHGVRERVGATVHPMLLVVDDVDGSQETAYELVPELEASAAESPLLVVVCSTDEEDSSRPDEPRPVAFAASQRRLRPLAAGAIKEIVAWYGVIADARTVRELAAASGGVPRAVHALAARLAEEQARRSLDDAVTETAHSRQGLVATQARVATGVLELRRARERARELAAEPRESVAGTVTFLFTDVEDSTVLLQELGDRYSAALADHRRILRAAAAAAGGREVDARGEEFLFAFPRATDALAAAVEAQRALAALPRPGGKPLRVRVGLHTGEPSVTEEGYLGLDVHRGARICAAARGGQVLMSRATRELVVGSEPAGSHVVDLGEHALKGVRRPERLFQLVAPGLAPQAPSQVSSSEPFRGREEELARAAIAVAADVVCPFKGLAPFEAEDVSYFFGREQAVAELVARLVGTRFLAVVGPSGSGKSSLLRAGVLPALAEGVIPGSEQWRRVVVRPGARPLESLERARGETAVGERLVLAVDQLEEAFTLCEHAAQREGFFAELAAKATADDGQTIVLATVRADFLGRCAEHPELAALLRDGTALVGPLTDGELRRTISGPAERAGLLLDPGLVETIVAEVEGEPGALPLLQSVLLELWRQRDGARMTLRAYGRTGGVRGVVGRIAEHAYGRLGEADQRAARALLLRLADDGPGGEVVRRRVSPAELDAGRPEVAAALTALVDARLVTVSEGVIEVAHEALFREWPRLRAWLEEDAQGRVVRRSLGAAALAWEEADRDPGELLRAARLASTLEWASVHDDVLNATERAFLAASREASEREVARQRRTNRRLRVLLAGVAALLLLAVLAGVLALRQRTRADSAALDAQAQTLGAEALTEARLDRSLLLARQGEALHPSTVTRGNLLAAELRAPAAVAVMRGWKGDDVVAGRGDVGPSLFAARSACVDAAPDGSTLVAGDGIGGLVVFDQRTFERLREIRVPIVRCGLGAFSPDGSTFVTHIWLTLGGTPGLGLGLFDVRAGTARSVPMARAGAVQRRLVGPPAFSPDGSSLLTLETPVGQFAAGEWPEILAVRRDPRTGAERGRPVPIGVREGIARAAFLPGGGSVVVSASAGAQLSEKGRPGTATVLLDADTFQPQRRFAVSSHVSALSPDGRLLALARVPTPDRVTLLDLGSGHRRVLNGRHEGGITGVGFSPDGVLVTTGDDRTVVVWDADGGAVRERLQGHAGAAFGPAFSSDGRTAFTAGLDEAVIAWDLSGDRRLSRQLAWASEEELPGPGSWTGAALARDGRVLFRGAGDGRVVAVRVLDGHVVWTAEVWDPERLELLGTAWRRVFERSFARLIPDLPPAEAAAASGLSGNVISVAVSPDGKLVAATAQTQEVVLLDATSGRVVRRWRASRVPWVNTATFSADGRFLVTGDDDGRVAVWDPHNGRRLSSFRIPKRQVVVALPSPDGKQVAVFTQPSWLAYRNGRPPPSERARIGVWDVATGTPAWDGDASELNFWARPVLAADRDWHTLASGGFPRDVRLWDLRNGKSLGLPLAASEGFALSAAFDPSGRVLATAGTDGRVRLFDIVTRLPLGGPLPGDDDHWTTALLDPEGKFVLALADTGRGWLWDISPEGLRDHACRVANRLLTETEWRRYLPDRAYEPACR